MTYRDLTEKQKQRLRKQCFNAMQAYGHRPENQPLNPAHWQAAWSRAFLAGAAFVEAKQKRVDLFDSK